MNWKDNNSMELVVKSFDDLTTQELYEIYKIRFSVFVVEQECCYQDADDFDPLAIHAWYKDEDGIQAYIRVLPPNTVFTEPSIGRVLAVKRRQGLGTGIVREGIRIIKDRFNSDVITIEAQCYARELYEKIGFVQTSDEFLEDGIPHIKMQYYFEN